MRVCQNHFPGMRALRNVAFAVSAAALLSACSSAGLDRLSGDASSDNYTASVSPADDIFVQAQPLDGGAGTQSFSARPVQSYASSDMPPAQPVMETAPEPVTEMAQAPSGASHKVKPGETL